MFCSNQDIQLTIPHPESQINSSRQFQSYQQFQLSNPSFKYPPKPIAQEPSIISEQDNQSKSQDQYYQSHKQVPNNTLIRNGYEESSDLPKYIRQKSKSINFIEILKQYQQIYDKSENVTINSTTIEQQQCKLIQQNIIIIWNYLYLLSIYILLIYIPIQNYYQQYDVDDQYIMVFISIKLIDILLLIFEQVDAQNFNSKLKSNLNDYYQYHLIQDFIQIITLSMQFISSINLIYKFILLIIIIYTLKKRYITLRTDLHIPYKSVMFPLFDLITYTNCLACIYVSTLQNQDNYLNSISQIISIITLQNNYQPTNDSQTIIYAFLQLFSLIPLVYILKVCSTLIDQIKAHDNCITEKNRDLKYFKILKSYFTQYSNNSLQKCTQYLQTIQTKTNEIILQNTSQIDASLYFILQGKYSIITNQHAPLAKVNSQFGEIAFFTDQPSKCIINSDTEGVLLKLQLKHFIQCLDDLDRQTYLNTRNQIIFQQHYPTKCSCCKFSSHHISQCPKLTYIPNKFDILTKHSKSSFNHRQPFFKRTRPNRDIHSLQFYKFAQLRLQEFVELFNENIGQNSSLTTSNNRLPYEDEIQSSSPYRLEGDGPSDNQLSFHLEQYNDKSSNNIEHDDFFQIPRRPSEERPLKTNSHIKIPKSFGCLESILEQDSFENVLQHPQFKSKQYELNKHRTSIQSNDKYLSQQKLQKPNKQLILPKSNSFQQFSPSPILQQSYAKNNVFFQQNLSLEYDCHLQFDIDKMQTYKFFQPHHNYNQTIFDYNHQKHF